MKPALNEVKAIVFDTFGTVVDWRTSIIADLSAWAGQRGLPAGTVDWEAFVQAWRGLYEPQKDRVKNGSLPWTHIDALHLEALESILPKFGLTDLSPADKLHVNRVWHRLNPWPDVLAGLHALKPRYILGPLSNGSIALLVNMARHASLPWDCIFSAEHFRHYKPHPDTYLGVCRQLQLEPHEVMMCAAHNYDLRAARALGLRTGFIVRPTEYGPAQAKDMAAEDAWDVIADSMTAFAAAMPR